MPKGRQKGDGRGRMGGRQKGTQNKLTSFAREKVIKFCDENFEEFVSAWHAIEDKKEKCDIYIKAQGFVLPKLSSVDIRTDVKEKTFQDELDELDKEA